MSLDPKSGIQKQDAFYVFQAVGKTQLGTKLAWAKVQQNWPFIFE